MSQSQKASGQFSYSEKLLPQAEMLEEKKYKKSLYIGIPKETDKYENRIILTPQAVKQLADEGHKIVIEPGAGIKSRWKDSDYTKAGAGIVSRKEVFKSEIILKVSPFDEEDIRFLSGNQLIISTLHFNTQSSHKINKLKSKKVTAVAIELMKDAGGFNPFIQTMSEISGILAINTASEYLSNPETSKGILLGGITGIPAARLIIIGAGTAGEYAARTALGLGAQVKVFDPSLSKLQNLKSKLGIQLFTSVFQKEIISKALKTADVVIGAIDYNKEDNINIISEKMVASMKNGSVIIDLNTDSASCFASSKITHLGNPAFEKHGIIHYCVPNITSKASRTASVALSNTIFPVLQKISHEKSTPNIVRNITEIRNGTYIYEGILTNERLGRQLYLDFKDIDLLTAIF
ncbi:MAG: alanine dehydrogenase [Bacteroidales bacterium]|nr:alanine dehydrogenase [Bacteroidales bacterium]